MWQHWTSVFAQSPQVHIDYEANRAIKWVQGTPGTSCQAGISLGQQKAKTER